MGRGRRIIPPQDVGPIEYGAALMALSPSRRAFVLAFIACGSASEAARRAGYAVPSATRQGWNLLQDRSILAAIAEEAPKYYRALVGKAIRETERILDSPTAKDADKLRAADGVLSRADPVLTSQRIDVQHTHTVALDHTAAALEALKFMKSMDVPRAKLIEHFGHSGLTRYERMAEMEDLDATARAKLIEAREVV